MNWDHIRDGHYTASDAGGLIDEVAQGWPHTLEPLTQLLEAPVPAHLDSFIAGVLIRAQQRELLAQPQAEAVAMRCLRLIAAKRRGTSESCFVAETLNAVAARVPELLAQVSGIEHLDMKAASFDELLEIKSDLAANARALDFTNVSGGSHLLDQVVALRVRKVSHDKVEVMTLGGMTWRGLSPWAYEPVANAFVRAVTESFLDRDSKLMSCAHELGSILSTIGGFNSIHGRSEKHNNDVVIGAITLITQIEELLSAESKKVL
jgi:hypothetical protein